MTRKYFAYIRVSTAKQGEQGSSLAEQKAAITAYADRNGLAIATWFEEIETAAKQGRREFSQLLAQLRKGVADGLIIHKIDRSARNLRDWSDLGDLIDRGVDVRFVSDNFDLLSRGGRLSADIQAVVAADYIRNLRDEVKKGLYGRLKQGFYPWAAPIGYLNAGKAKPKVIDPVTGPLVRELFERYASGTVAFERLRHEMWSKGLRSRAGEPLHRCNLTAILNNPFYVGVLRVKGETFAGVHEPLISAALFERVQAVLRGKTVPKTQMHKYLFRQLVRCTNCGRRTLTGERQKGHIYYRCHGALCRGVCWRQDVLEAAVLMQLSRACVSKQDVGDIGDMVRTLSAQEKVDTDAIRSGLTLRLQQLDARAVRLTDLLIDGAIDREIHSSRKQALLIERQGLLEALAEGKDQPSKLAVVFGKFELRNRELLRYEILAPEEKRKLVQTIGSNFSASTENVEFALRFPFSEIAETGDPMFGGPVRNDVRTLRPKRLLKLIATTVSQEAFGELGDGNTRYNVPEVPKVLPFPRRHQRLDQPRLHSDKAAA